MKKLGKSIPEIISETNEWLDVALQKHYTNLKIQPIEYIMQNNIDYCEGNVIKYVSRWKEKGGIEDLEKAKVYLDFLIRKEKGEKIV